MLKQLYPLGENHEDPLRNGLATLMAETVFHPEADGETFLMVHPVDAGLPEGILREENYREFTRLKQRITEQIGSH